MAKRVFEIESVFCKWLGAKAREMNGKTSGFKIIEVADFPEGAPIHEDGSAEYDPAKPLVLFAVCISSSAALRAWNEVCRQREQLLAA